MALQSLPDKLQTLQLDCWLMLLHHSLPPSATVPTGCSLSAWVGGRGSAFYPLLCPHLLFWKILTYQFSSGTLYM